MFFHCDKNLEPGPRAACEAISAAFTDELIKKLKAQGWKNGDKFTVKFDFSEFRACMRKAVIVEVDAVEVEKQDVAVNKTTEVNSALDSFIINFESVNFLIFDNVSFNLYLNFFFIIFLFSLVYTNNFFLKNVTAIINIVNNSLIFFFNIFKTLIKSVRLERFFIFILAVFTFVLFQNLGGFSLFEVSFTSHAVITLFLSFIIFFNYFINYLINFNEKSHKKFVQKKLNVFLILILFLIEVVSFFVRPFSLGVRLFANILSGHILMHIFFNAFLYAYKMFFWFSLFFLIFSIFILTMEIFVSCVQAYIFFMLSVIYLQDVEKLH